ncbi:MAG: SIR2 family protein [Candidatus Thiodiazotropha endolucinida]
MRFLENGADIPDELINTVTDGNAVFLCGAGVSKRVDLDLFKELTEKVYQELGESRDHEPAERIAFKRGEFDRVLNSLEKRTHQPGTQSRVRNVVSNNLKAPDNIDFPDHRALLQLSRDSDGRPKLLTTNFDTIFERVVQADGLNVPSYAVKSIPKPGGVSDYGIFHLHGRIGDETLDLKNTDLILTSADFGDAYLRDGWASRYVEDRMRLNTIVLVGYQAEDAALRLLLETLDADRDRFKDLKDIFAIDKRTDDSASIWRAKGIWPIEFEDYPDIYETLAEWSKYNINPIEYSNNRIESILTETTQQPAMEE